MYGCSSGATFIDCAADQVAFHVNNYFHQHILGGFEIPVSELKVTAANCEDARHFIAFLQLVLGDQELADDHAAIAHTHLTPLCAAWAAYAGMLFPM